MIVVQVNVVKEAHSCRSVVIADRKTDRQRQIARFPQKKRATLMAALSSHFSSCFVAPLYPFCVSFFFPLLPLRVVEEEVFVFAGFLLFFQGLKYPFLFAVIVRETPTACSSWGKGTYAHMYSRGKAGCKAKQGKSESKSKRIEVPTKKGGQGR
ncbi:hypothetical protein F5H01DRAFT_333711 [Linnemannia elongata]|nr:hypothetical protein F5H01DRAFT_333711 [Linnemannia elongata]